MIKLKKKAKGFLLMEAALASIAYGMLAIAFFTIFSGQFSMLDAGRTAAQAQQYADVVANTLKLQPIDDIVQNVGGELTLDNNYKLALNNGTDESTKHKLTALFGNNDKWKKWQYNVSIEDGPANTNNNGDKLIQKIATVRIFKDGDTLSRYSEEVPLSLQGSGNLPIGAILPYHGDLTKIPHGWYLCDGKNGTPDLRDRFIVGAGSNYQLDWNGGSTTHKITNAELPDIASYLNQNLLIRGSNQMNGDTNRVGNALFSAEYNWKNEGNLYGWYKNAFSMVPGSVTNQPFDIRPPYYALYWIMHVK